MEQLNIFNEVSIGFTGTRWGMSPAQNATVAYIVRKLVPTHAHHGMCKGADTQFHGIVRSLTKAHIKGHPPIKKDTYIPSECDEYAPEDEYIKRDYDIVDESQCMIGTPNTKKEVLRSGTWTTIRYAKKVIKADKGKCKGVYIVLPSGKIDFWDYKRLTS